MALSSAEYTEAEFLSRADLIRPLMEKAYPVLPLHLEPSVMQSKQLGNFEMSSKIFCL